MRLLTLQSCLEVAWFGSGLIVGWVTAMCYRCRPRKIQPHDAEQGVLDEYIQRLDKITRQAEPKL